MSEQGLKGFKRIEEWVSGWGRKGEKEATMKKMMKILKLKYTFSF